MTTVTLVEIVEAGAVVETLTATLPDMIEIVLPGPQGGKGDKGDAGAPGLVHAGDWSSTTTYSLDQTVAISGSFWRALRANTNVTPVEGLDWTLLAGKGDTGARGLEHQGEWVGIATYVRDDAVTYNGDVWRALRTNFDVAPVESLDWTLFAAKGVSVRPRGAYAAATAYTVNDLVTYNDRAYVLKVAGPVTGSTPSGTEADTIDWQYISGRGLQGIQGFGYTWFDAWAVGATYSALDTVRYNGAAYVAVMPLPAAGTPPTDAAGVVNAGWNLMVAKGDKGDKGLTGDAATVEVVGTTTSAPDGDAVVTQGGTSTARTLAFTIPRGSTGPIGPAWVINRGVWASGTSYVTDDSVLYNGTTWRALRASAGVTPVEGLDWTVIAAKGADGVDGVNGTGSVSTVNGDAGPNVILAAADVDALPASTTAADIGGITTSQKGAANGVASLGVDGKLPSAQIPAIALSEFLGTTSTETAMIALTGERGDWTVRTDFTPNRTYILSTDDPTLAANWVQASFGGEVTSVNGQVGTVVLTAANVSALPDTATAADVGALADTTVGTDVVLTAGKLTLVDERVQDIVGAMAAAGTGVTYDDVLGAISAAGGGGAGTIQTRTHVNGTWEVRGDPPAGTVVLWLKRDAAMADPPVDATYMLADVDAIMAVSDVPTAYTVDTRTAAEWTAANPILLDGEPGFESDTRKIKYGDGVTAWDALDYLDAITTADANAAYAAIDSPLRALTSTVVAEESTTSTTFVALTTALSLTLTAGPQGKFLVTLGADSSVTSSLRTAIMGFQITRVSDGVVVVTATDNNAYSHSATAKASGDRTFLHSGLTPGASYTVTALHRVTNADATAAFRRRTITVAAI